MKYNADGDLGWVINYTNSDFSGSSDEPFAMFVDTAGIVYVTGMSALDYATIEYVPVPVSVENSPQNIPNQFALEQNYPNPFNPTTKIKYTIPTVTLSLSKGDTYVTLKVYDVLGNVIATLVDEYKPAGSYEVNFNASQLSSGIYFYTLKTGTFIETKKMTLLK